MEYAFYDSPHGWMKIGSHMGKLCLVQIVEKADGPHQSTVVTDLAYRQLMEYFEGQRKSFDLPILISGTKFQQAVFGEMMKIPYGETCTYGEIAARIGYKKACRAVGMACHMNPLWIVIPCHRVVGKTGMTGYAGGMDMKRRLLQLEGITVKELENNIRRT